MEVGYSWYIDAWSPVDGYAFASVRPPHSIAAERTIFVAPPAFQPVPVARISTALRATRSSFQEGLLDEEGNEIAFETLQQVSELVRRGYLAGGLGYDPTPGNAPPAPRGPSSPSGSGAPAYEPIRPRDRGPLADFLDLLDAGRVREAFAGPLDGEAPFRVQLRQYAAATRAHFVAWRPGLEHSHWSNALHRMSHVMGESGLDDEMPHFRPWATVPMSLLFEIPVPHVSEWSPSVRTAADKLFLALASPRYFSAGNDVTPLLFAAFLLMPPCDPERTPASHFYKDRLRRAFNWITSNVSQVDLPDAAESALYAFAWARLESRK